MQLELTLMRDEILAQIHPQDNLRMLGRIKVNSNCINCALWEAWIDGLLTDEKVETKTLEHRRQCISCQRNYEHTKADKEHGEYSSQLPQCIHPQLLYDWRAGKVSDEAIEATAEHRKQCIHCEGEYQYNKAGKERTYAG